jgi:sirohydrochlorin ferrochelatase
MKTALIIVDHGSRRSQSNQMLEEVARLFGERFAQKYDIVEPAHMELAEPSIASAYAACAGKGATRIVVVPFFLGPGKHWTSDIPRLTAEAAVEFPDTKYHVTQTLGIDDLILDLLDKRASHCVEHHYDCEVCRGTLRSGEIDAAAIVSIKAEKAESGPQVCGTCPFKGQPLPAALSGGA